ncbi:hypothetical protein EV426DRAFT_579013 [Tirmania nivea]|nr:hypothetical protein EV426DRAFT_579013 [Tirmania nivea]
MSTVTYCGCYLLATNTYRHGRPLPAAPPSSPADPPPGLWQDFRTLSPTRTEDWEGDVTVYTADSDNNQASGVAIEGYGGSDSQKEERGEVASTTGADAAFGVPTTDSTGDDGVHFGDLTSTGGEVYKQVH